MQLDKIEIILIYSFSDQSKNRKNKEELAASSLARGMRVDRVQYRYVACLGADFWTLCPEVTRQIKEDIWAHGIMVCLMMILRMTL